MRYPTILIAAAFAAATPALAHADTPSSPAAREGAASSERPSAARPRARTRPRRPRAATLQLDPATRQPTGIGRAARVGSAPIGLEDSGHGEGLQRRPAWRVAGGVPLTWRSASSRPELGTGLQFSTETPYLGLDVEGQVFPQRGILASSLPPWAEPLGLSLSLSHRVLTSRFGDQDLGSREQRAALDLLYERPLASRTRLTGRAGWAWHRFAVDENPVIGTVTHGGLRLGVDAAHPIHPRVEALAGLRVMPWAGAGGAEADARGDASDGWGMQVLLGLGGPIPRVRGLGWRVAYDYLRFSDSYAGAGHLSSGGSGVASHHALLVGATWQR